MTVTAYTLADASNPSNRGQLALTASITFNCAASSQTLTFDPTTVPASFGSTLPADIELVINTDHLGAASPTFTVSFSKFTETNTVDCFATSIVLKDSTGSSPHPTLSATFDPVGRGYSIDFDVSAITTVATQYEFQIHAPGYNLAASSTITVKVVCGSETISVDSTVPLEVMALGSSQSQVLASDSCTTTSSSSCGSHPNWYAIFSTSESDCPVTNFEVYSDISLSSPLTSPSGPVYISNKNS